MAGLLTGAGPPVRAAEPGLSAAGPVLRSVIDNDEFVGLNRRDRWYSSGVVIMGDRADPLPPDPLASRLPCQMPTQDAPDARRAWAFGQVIGMQNRRDLTMAAANDRPIGALLWLSHLRARFSPYRDAGWAMTINTTGPAALGEPVQNGLHRMLGVDQVAIWNQQLRPRTGLELRLHCLQRTALGIASGSTFSVGWELVLGNRLTQFETQIAIALGPSGAAMRPVREARLAWPVPMLTRGWGLIAGLRLRAVARDGLLDGPTFGYENRITARHAVLEWFAGGQWRLTRHWQLGYAIVRRSMDFDGPGVAGAHYDPQTFGQLTLSLAF
ncbi:MAG: DUF2219 family protein [Burkholderiaceae bacterium]